VASKLTTTKTLVGILALLLMVFASNAAATTTVTDCGDGHKTVTFTATADTLTSNYNVSGYIVKAIRVEAVDGAKTYRIRKGTAATGTVLWRGYTTGASSGTTFTLESLPEMAVPSKYGLYFDTNSSTCTVEMYLAPR
jgi:hypothetical protein